MHIDPRTDVSPSTPIICLLRIFLQFFDLLVELLDHFVLSDLYPLLATALINAHILSYLQHEKCRLPILHSSKVQELAVGFITALVADLHALEDGCIKHNSMHVLCPHDYARLPLELWCFFVGAFFELEANVDLQVANTSLFPFSVLEVIKFRSTFDNDFLVLFASLA